MPPKPKFSKEEIVEAAIDLVRNRGAEALSARELGNYLGISSRPIFTAFENMEDLKSSVIKECIKLFEQRCKKEIDESRFPQYKAIGSAYIRFSVEEKNIFKLLFMRDRSDELQYGYDAFDIPLMSAMKQSGVEGNVAELLHTEMWIWVHGVATMLATGYVDWNSELISKMMTDVFTALKWRHTNGNDN